MGPVVLLALVFGVSGFGAQAVLAATPRQWSLAGDHLPLGVASRTDTVPGSNNIVDFVFSSPSVWAGTASGVSRADLPNNLWTLSPSAIGWTTYTKEDGLGSNEIPALGVFPSGVWAATSHAEVRADRLVRFGDGIFQFDAGTGHWIDRSPADRQASGPFMVAYDLAEFRGAVLAACFAGGLVMTTDGGTTWKNIYPDGTAKNDFETKQFLDLNNRLFSVVVDPAVPESVAVYAGTAYGINKYIYLNDTLKMTGYRAAALAVDGARLYAATESGLSRTPDRGSSWKSYYPSRAFPTSDRITAVMARGDSIYYGVASADGTAGNGIVYSLDNGHTWHWSQPVEATGPGRQVAAIVLAAGMVFAACEDGGFISSANLGLSWDPVFVDQPAHALLVVQT
ncbi:MAG: hypothetical protein HY304_03750, partial [candidate division Zixibacteria bacterium]|nr:hypothetical protein [candidate division Zixibacteria bacterium]